MFKNLFREKNSFKYNKLIVAFILGMIIISPSIKNSLAERSTGIEVKEEDRYEWRMKLNISNYIELMSNTGKGTVPTEIVALDLQGDSDGLISLTVIFEILNIQENFNVDSFFDITYTIVEAELTIAPEYNITQIPIFFPLNFSIKHSPTRTNFSVLKGDTLNYFSVPIGFFLIVPTDLDWTSAATQLQSYFGRNFVSSNYTVSPQDNGLKMTQPAETTIIASELNLNYNSKGVLETADGSYNSSLLFSLELASDGTIAFELPFLLSVFTIAIVILLLRKRKNIKLH